MKNKELKYKKVDFLNSKFFRDKKDIINVLLADDEEITIKELENKINNFLKKEVK